MSTASAADLRPRVQAQIDAMLRGQSAVLAELGPDVEDLLTAIGSLLQGGKRLRASFLYWGYRAAGAPDSDALVRLATSMEFFQAAALIHDDVMDDSDTRRGMPAAHRAFASSHCGRGWSGDADRFGAAGAILAGNLCLLWTEELFATCGLPAEHLAAGRPVFDRMRTQLMAGQFLDVVESHRPWSDLSDAQRLQRAERVIHYKSAKYTVEHPLLIGASAAGLASADLQALSDYGLALGHAFQLRDDVLGVFGDPASTGKPAGDDLREGKRTVLIAHTLAGASAPQRERVEAMLGRPDLSEAQVREFRDIIASAGAVDAVEKQIAELTQAARAALSQAARLEPNAAAQLDALIAIATDRAT